MTDAPPTGPDELHLCVFEANVDAHPRAALARSLIHCMSQRLTTQKQKRYDGMLYGPGVDDAVLRGLRCAQITSVEQLVAWAGADLDVDARAHIIKSLANLRDRLGYATPPIELVLEACPDAALEAAIAAVEAPLGAAPPPWVARALDGMNEPRLALATSVRASRRNPIEWTRAFAKRRGQFRKDVTVEFQLDANKLEPLRESFELLSSSEIHGVQLTANHRPASIESLVDSLPEGLRRLDVGELTIDGLKALTRCSALRSVRDLRLSTRQQLDAALDNFGVACEQLERLDFMTSAQGSAGATQRLCASGRLGSIEDLRVYGSTITDEDLAALAEAAPSGTLRALELSNVSLSPEGASRFGRARAFGKLQSLTVRGRFDRDASASAIAFAQACEMPSLARFEWDEYRMPPEQARWFVSEITANPSFSNVRSIKLSHLGDAALYAMASTPPLATLDRVELSATASADALIAMVRSPWLDHVRSLTIRAVLSEPVIIALCATPSLAGLESLDITPQQLTARAAIALREATFARSLRQLTMFASAVTDDGASALCDDALRTQLWRLTLMRKAIAPDAQWALTRAYGPALHLL